jgi:hypothetical protein
MLPASDLSQQHILPSLTRFNTILHYVTTLDLSQQHILPSFTRFSTILHYVTTLDLSQQHILPSFTRFNTILHYVTSLRFITTTHFTFIYPLQYNFTLCYQP